MRYFVEIRSEYDHWDELGSVLLPPGSGRIEVEGALRALGVYAPRGLDMLEWLDTELAIIRDAWGSPMVRLIGVPRLEIAGER